MASYVYVVTSTGHYDDYKRAETSSFLKGVFRDEDRALRLATEAQLEYIESQIADEDPEGSHYLTTRQEIIAIRSMRCSERQKFDEAIKLLDKILPDPKYTQYASQCRYKVLKMELDHSYEGEDEDSYELCLFPPPP